VDETGVIAGSSGNPARALIQGVARQELCSLCHMKRTTVRELHLQTSAIVRAVADGESYIIEKLGVPGRILEEDRS
jgi:hypothetical protein